MTEALSGQGWSPDGRILNDVLDLFRASQNPSASNQKRVSSGIEELKARSDGVHYLCYIFASEAIEVEVRQLAGLVLKNVLPSHGLTEAVGQQILQSLCDPQAVIRSTSGTIITSILTTVGLDKWPAALTTLNSLILNAPSMDVAISVLETYKKIVQDELDDRVGGSPSAAEETVSPTFITISKNEFLPMLLRLCDNDQIDKRLKLLCLEILEVFNSAHAFAAQEFAREFFHPYWACIGRVALDPTYRLVVLNCFNTVLQYNVDMIAQNSSNILNFFVTCSGDADYNARLAAMNFWPEILKESGTPLPDSGGTLKDLIAPHVPRLTAILVEHTRCTDIDLAEIDPAQLEDENALIPDVSNLAPRFHQNPRKQLGSDDADDDDGAGDAHNRSAWGNVWTVRKAAGLALDNLALYFGGDLLLPVCLPVIERKLQTEEDSTLPNGSVIPAWMERESGILILGAISKGCMASLSPFIPNILALLVKISGDQKPLLRSISCWCIARFSSWYCRADQSTSLDLPLPALAVESLGNSLNKPSTHLQQALYTLLVRMLDKNKCVQEASCSAIAVVFEEVGNRRIGITSQIPSSSAAFDARNIIAMELPVIYECFGKCLRCYQTKNLTLVMDAVSSLAQSIGSDMTEAHPNIVNEKLFAPLFEKFASLSPDAYETSACCEAITNVTSAVGPAILPMAKTILSKALTITEHQLVAIKAAGPTVRQSTHVMEACVDLISYVLDTAGVDSYSLLKATANENEKDAASRLSEVIQICVCDPDFASYTGFQQSMFALIGDIAPTLFAQILAPLLSQILPVIVVKLLHASWPVSSNASWCLGQIVEQTPDNDPALAQFVPMIMTNLSCIITRDSYNLALKQNACITLGRFARTFPALVAPQLEPVLMAWCNIMMQYKGYTEKIKAFKGITAALMHAPEVARAHVDALNDCLADFYAPGASRGDPEFEQFIADSDLWFKSLRARP